MTASRFRVALLLALFICASHPAAARIKRSQQEMADHKIVREKLESEKRKGKYHYALNLANPPEYRFYMAQLARAGVTPAKKPQLFRTLEKQRQNHVAGRYLPYERDQFVIGTGGASSGTDPIQVVSAINPLTGVTGIAGTGGSANTFAAAAISSIQGGTNSTSLTLALYDTASNDLLGTMAWGGGNGAGQDYTISNSATDTAITAYAQFTYQWTNSVGSIFGPYITSLNANSAVQPTLTSTDPPNSTTNITACYQRYGCTYNPPTGSTNGLLIPLVGNAVYPFGVSLSNNIPTGGNVNWALVDATAGGGCQCYEIASGPSSISQFFNGTNTTVNTSSSSGVTTISWNWNSSLFQLTGPACYTNGHTYNFTFYLDVPAPTSKGGSAQDVSVQITSTPPNNPGTNTIQTGTFVVKSGCLAAGTEIELADGSRQTIERFRATGEKVRSSGNRSLSVVNYSSGAEERPMVRIIDDKGHQLLLTETHPVVTASRGTVTASELTTADSVMTDAGPSKLTAVTRMPYSGPVYNLELGAPGESFTAGETTMYANHILVGDWTMQNARVEAARRSPEAIYAGLPPEWREDYLSTVDAATAGRLRGKKQ